VCRKDNDDDPNGYNHKGSQNGEKVQISAPLLFATRKENCFRGITKCTSFFIQKC
jgi:hypothetical protein